jgi:malonyl CoA-acyl carrier protein transacylase/acyl carrier protein
MAGVLADWMAGAGAEVPLVDVAHTINHRRTRHKYVASVSARDRTQAVAGLRALAAGHTAPGLVDAHEEMRGRGTVFVYSGQGSQWAGMGRQLLADEPAFATAVAELEPVFVEQVGFSLQQVLSEGQPVVGDARVQPVLTGLQLALTELWRSYGVEPDAVVGHSMGEVSAAVVAGALTPAEGLRVIATRSRLMARLAGQGAVALLELDAEAAKALIADYPGVDLAGYLSPRQTVIAGPPEQVDAVIAEATVQERFARRVNMEVASHTALMDPILPELRNALADLVPKAPTIPFFSTVSDAAAPTLDAAYWVANVREPVRLQQAITVAAENHATFLEVSPHPLLTYAVGDTLQSTSSADRVMVTSAMKRGEDDTLFFHAQLAAFGVTAGDAGGGRLADLPPSPWQHSRYWIPSRSLRQRLPDSHPLLGVHVEMPSGRDHVWQADLGTEMMPWLADHKVNGQSLMPEAVFAEIVLAAGREVLGLPVDALQVDDLEVQQPLTLDRQTRVTTQLAQSDNGIRVEIHASSAGNNWSRHAVAGVSVISEDGRAGVTVPSGSDSEFALQDEATDHPRYCIHPLVLDAALLSLTAAIAEERSEGPSENPYLPVSFDKIRVFGKVGIRTRCRTELVSSEHEGGDRVGRIVLMGYAETPVAEITGIRLRPMDASMVQLPLARKIFDTEWVESSSFESTNGVSAAPGGSWLLLVDNASGADAETEALVAEFTSRFRSSSRRVISAELSDESAVREAFAKAASDSEPSAVGVIVFVGKPSFDGADSEGALRRARDLTWSVSVAGRAAVDGSKGTNPRVWLVTRNGLAVRGADRGDPAIGALKGLVRTWRFPGEAARVLGGEPDVGATLVDLDSSDDVVAILIRELDSPARDDVIGWREGRRYVERLSRASLDAGGGPAIVRADGSYIVTGGLGGLGMVVTRWLAARGAGRLVLNGRTEPSDSQQRELVDLANGSEIVFVPGDIASPGVAERLVAAAEETGRPLRGVVHAAGVIADGQGAALTRQELERVWAPKVAGALSLHAATATHPLDWWVGFSSVASLMGLPGQMVYASANAWLDALGSWRRAKGLPATTINWGQWSDIGLSRSLAYTAVDPITPAEGIEALESLAGSNLTRAGVARLRLDRALVTTPEFRDLGYFDRLVGEFDTVVAHNRSVVGDPVPAVAAPDWSRIPAENRIGELETRLRAILARELRMSPSAIGVDKPFPELGLDSMMAMTILRESQRLVGIDMSATMLWNHPTVSSLAAYLAEMLAPQQVPQKSDADMTLDSESSVLDELFDSVESASAGRESGIW